MTIKEIPQALTFDDVLLKPGYSNILPKDTVLKTALTKNISLNIPLISAAMDTVTDADLAIAMAGQGGIGILHKNMSVEVQAREVKKVKKYESGVVRDPITVSPETTLKELNELSDQYHISGMPVVNGEQLVGIITSRDVRFETDLSQPVKALMTGKKDLITIDEEASQDEIMKLFREHRLEKILLVNKKFELRGLVTVKDVMKSKQNPLSCKDNKGQLRVGAAIGTGKDSQERAVALITAGVDVLVVDTAHGYSQGVLDQVTWLKKNHPGVEVIAGNIATGEAATALAKAGADAVKVGLGPGSICITRIVAGIGVPQISAIQDVHEALKDTDVKIIADGGIRYSGDICKALAAGAHTVMMGSIFAGTEEAPGEVVLYQGRSYKEYRGMGSIPSMSAGSSDRYFQSHHKKPQKLVPEGIEGRVPFKGPLAMVLHQLTGGIRSSMGYTGCKDVEEMRTKTEFIRVTNAGMKESHAHDITITKEAPNYSVED